MKTENITNKGVKIMDGIRDRNTENPYMEIKWYLSDILEEYEDLTKDECIEVLELMKGSHDYDNGITWEIIDNCVEIVKTNKEESKNWYFSFGVDHIPYNKNYVKIHGTCNETRDKMFEKFGKRWCFQYPNLNGENSLNADKWGLTELLIEEI